MSNQIQVTTQTQGNHVVYICNTTKQPYVNLAQLQIIFPNIDNRTIRRRLEGVALSVVKNAEVQTAGGLQGVALFPASVVSDLAFEFDLSLAKLMGSAGATAYLYGLVGYQAKPQLAQVDSPPRQLPPPVSIYQYMVISERWGLDSDPLIKSLISRRLAEELGGKVLAPATQVALTVRAAELGYDSRLFGNGIQLSKFVSKRLEPKGQHVYDLTPELDECIHAYFR